MAAVCEALAAKWMFSLVAGGVCWLTSAHRLTWVTGLRPHQPSLANGRSRAASVGGKKFSSFLLLYNNKPPVHGFVVPGWGISKTHMLRAWSGIMETKRLQIYGSFPASYSDPFCLFTAAATTTSAAATQLSHQSRINVYVYCSWRAFFSYRRLSVWGSGRLQGTTAANAQKSPTKCGRKTHMWIPRALKSKNSWFLIKGIFPVKQNKNKGWEL